MQPTRANLRSPNTTSRKPAATEPADTWTADQIAAYAGDPDFMTSLARGLAVVRGFSQQQRGLSIAQLSLRTGIPRAAVRRCLYTLEKLGYVAAEDERTFALRPQILSLGHAYLSSTPLVMAAQPVLDRVSAALYESCSLAIMDSDEILYVARSASGKRLLSIDLGVGSRLPAHCTSMGRVLLAGLAPDDLASYLRRVKLAPHTGRTIVSRERLAEVLAGVRDVGYALVDQELEIGLRSIAVPVKDSRSRVVAAINIGTQASRVSVAEMQRSFLPALRDAAAELGLIAA
ncbi:MAG: helix-turn-helix domain-containing protein [Betaproteobacteria bacterium]|nr:helix-turn-helix domain-containing protein [Betaproteobacteria bacterium]MDE2208291.1 helix-turn-helix domain-containing protein [Betaproteobacteria bacterium]MDE2357915.1 helix-turn-helix domain-containing protein [Betaproteobacteria bacterium]